MKANVIFPKLFFRSPPTLECAYLSMGVMLTLVVAFSFPLAYTARLHKLVAFGPDAGLGMDDVVVCRQQWESEATKRAYIGGSALVQFFLPVVIVVRRVTRHFHFHYIISLCTCSFLVCQLCMNLLSYAFYSFFLFVSPCLSLSLSLARSHEFTFLCFQFPEKQKN